MISLFWAAVALCAAVGCWTIGLAIGRWVSWMCAVIGLYRAGIADVRREADE